MKITSPQSKHAWEQKYSVKTIKKNARGSKEKIAIAGFGREGKSVLKFFLRRNRRFLKEKEVWILDKNGKIKVPRGVNLQTGRNYLKDISRFKIIFRTPGIPYNSTEFVRARQKGVQISSATKLFFEHVHSMPMANRPKIIGITGTKGKGTTSTLLYKILKADGRDVRLAGNIGKPMLEVVGGLKSKSIAILEMSSFQLQDLQISPEMAVVLDVFPDHQDSHLSLKEYYDAKSSIVKNQKKRDFVFFFKNNSLSRRTAQKSKGKKIAIDEKTFKLFGQEDLKIRGYHNFKNAVMAATVAQTLGVPDGIIIKAVKSFRGTEHRLELARKIKIRGKDGGATIYFYNDSASTNPQTSAAAIKSFSGFRKILIAGGQDKNLDYKPLAEAVSLSGEKNSGVELVVLFGENKNKIFKALNKTKNRKPKIVSARNLSEAVGKSYSFAAKNKTAHRQWAILFSPGATSFDMFKNYADRGEKFKKIVHRLRLTQ